MDFLLDLEPGRSLFDLGGLLVDLQELLARNVDVITERGLRDRIRDLVLQAALRLQRALVSSWFVSINRDFGKILS